MSRMFKKSLIENRFGLMPSYEDVIKIYLDEIRG